VSRRALVAKTYKIYLGGAFVRSESGRSDPANSHDGAHVANVPRSSRKDVRDAVKAARAAQSGWARRTAYNRGQVLYRFAEALESRSDELARAAVAQQDASLANARAEVAEAVDLLVHYAGWTDKLSAVMGGINPVAAPYLSFSTPEPTGVVAVLAPDEPDLLGLIREVAPALAAGNTVVAVVSRRWPLRALDLGEVAGVSDVPGGVLNLLCGRMDELLKPLCGHRDVNAIVDASDSGAIVDELAAETVKRVTRPSGDDSLARLEALTELKTAWHPVGS
jgi:acyl-CoA reductase-like NAD-dependent aldehyde dehydrogenase